MPIINYMTTKETATNEEAVQAMISMLGGPEGMVRHNVRFSDLAQILNANPDDDLSGLRLIASRMVFSDRSVYLDGEDEELPITPSIAKSWLLDTDRAYEETGALVAASDIDHIGHAALTIASGQNARLLSEVYTESSNGQWPLSPDMVAKVGSMVVREYGSEDRIAD